MREKVCFLCSQKGTCILDSSAAVFKFSGIFHSISWRQGSPVLLLSASMPQMSEKMKMQRLLRWRNWKNGCQIINTYGILCVVHCNALPTLLHLIIIINLWDRYYCYLGKRQNGLGDLPQPDSKVCILNTKLCCCINYRCSRGGWSAAKSWDLGSLRREFVSCLCPLAMGPLS